MFARPIVILRRLPKNLIVYSLYFVLFEFLHFVQNDNLCFILFARQGNNLHCQTRAEVFRGWHGCATQNTAR